MKYIEFIMNSLSHGGAWPESNASKSPPTSSESRPRAIGITAAAQGLTNGKPGLVGKESAVNGTGLTNGSGLVNGTGLVNGSGLVNGTGIVNGTRASAGSAKRRPRGVGAKGNWKVLVVLVAIAVSLPTVMFLLYSEGPSPYTIDGSFSDWSDASLFSMRTLASSPSVNVSGWAVGTHGTQLYVFVETEEALMATSDVESVFLFADVDGSADTGYAISDIGAEYMIELDGWDGAVQTDMLAQFPASEDAQDWNLWEDVGSVVYELDGNRMEAAATLELSIRDSACFVLVVQNSHEDRSVSYSVPLSGGLLVIKQVAAVEGPGDGLADQGQSTRMMRLRFSCQGASGTVSTVPVDAVGASLVNAVDGFSMAEGSDEVSEVRLNTMNSDPGTFVSASVDASGVVSSFGRVAVVGTPSRAYVLSPPGSIEVDGAFADWDGRMVSEFDEERISNPDIDIETLGGAFEPSSSFFYVGVAGSMCDGSYVPTIKGKPTSGSSGGTVVHVRKSAEDVLRVFVDSDFSSATGLPKSVGSKVIGADYMIEVRGSNCRVTSTHLYAYASGTWSALEAEVSAVADSRRIEIGLPASAVGGVSTVDFIIETTDWKERTDIAGIDLESLMAMSSYFSSAIDPTTWIVESATSSTYATQGSFQRKLVYDGTNYWSFYFDGADTVYRYSSNSGVTWTDCGVVFKNTGIQEASVWFDSASNLVYIVGDKPSNSNNVYVQRGVLSSASKTITWAASDSALKVSSFPLSAKHTFICKDASGYLWVLASNRTSNLNYDLSAFKSTSVDSTSAWTNTGNMVSPDPGTENVKGVIVPSTSGSVVWSAYTYKGNVAARKYTGTWSSESLIYVRDTSTESAGNMDTAPPSAVVDSKGVMHIVYGTGHKVSGSARPYIYYTHNDTGGTTFTTPLRLDSVASTNGNVYPTISLDASTGNLFAFWIQIDNQNIICKKDVGGTWSSVSTGPQTSYTKQYLTSIYSAPSECNICWIWTQNTTGSIDVMFDKIPEFSDAFVPVFVVMMVMVVALRRKSSSRKDSAP